MSRLILNVNTKKLLYIWPLKGRIEIVNALLAKGVDVNAQDEYEINPLHLVTAMGQIEVVNIFLVKEGVDINAKDRSETHLYIWLLYMVIKR